MERLVTSSEAAQILGISLQGVHYRIKQGKLKSQKRDGKIFVYIDEDIRSAKTIIDDNKNMQNLIFIKDEQILFLKDTLKSTKKQYKNEIKRLENNQDKMMEVFKSEISLLQSAFNEMKTIYKIEEKNNKKSQETEENMNFGVMDIKDFFIYMRQSNKSDLEIKSIILERVKQGDNRFVFNRKTKEVIIYKSDFIDLI